MEEWRTNSSTICFRKIFWQWNIRSGENFIALFPEKFKTDFLIFWMDQACVILTDNFPTFCRSWVFCVQNSTKWSLEARFTQSRELCRRRKIVLGKQSNVRTTFWIHENFWRFANFRGITKNVCGVCLRKLQTSLLSKSEQFDFLIKMSRYLLWVIWQSDYRISNFFFSFLIKSWW